MESIQWQTHEVPKKYLFYFFYLTLKIPDAALTVCFSNQVLSSPVGIA